VVLNNSGWMTEKISETIQKSKPTTERYIKILKEIKIIEFRGAPKTGGYYLTKSVLSKIKKKI
jgi:ATP-dependent DNA helicase RecG